MRRRRDHQGFDLGSSQRGAAFACSGHACGADEGMRRWMPVWCELGTERRHNTQCMQPPVESCTQTVYTFFDQLATLLILR